MQITMSRVCNRWCGSRLPLVAVLLSMVAGAQIAYGQSQPATLTGIVSDQSNAVIPNANVVLKQQSTGSLRRTVSNTDGYFTISGIPAGTYDVSVEAQGFVKWERTGVVFHPGDKINLPDILLPVGTSEQKVEVVGVSEDIITDSSEKAEVITSKEIQNLAVLGRSADELLKILPGVVYTDPDGQGQPAGFRVQFNQGIGNYNVNGTRNTQVENVSDGQNVIDPGCQCGSAVTPNVDMVQEVKVQTSNFAAENNRGPIIFSAVSKSGGSDFHGEAYFYGRNAILNARDWRNNFFDTKKPQDSFYFPGFNIGGPITKGRQKLFFFAGVEYMGQNHDLGVRPATVPTAAMRAGDFTDTAYIAALNGSDVNLPPMNDQELSASGNGWINSGDPLTPQMVQGGKVNPAYFDKGGSVLLNLLPMPNQDPGKSGGYNYTSNIINPEHRNQELGRVDYNISDSTKLYTRFNREYQASPYPFTLWWYNSNDVPFPGKLKGDYHTYSSSTSLVKVLNPSTTNEVVLGVTDWAMPHKVLDPKAVSRSALGYPYHGLFNASADLIPSFTDWGSGVPDFVQPGGLLSPTIYGNKWLINLNDNFTKVTGTHTLKFGYFMEHMTNDEPTTDNDQSIMSPTQWGGNSTGNAFADLLLGRVGDYSESTKNLVGHHRKWENSFFAQDSWKVTRRLTLEIGSRFQHDGWLYERDGHYFTFVPKLYDPKAPLTAFSGLEAKYKGDPVSDSIWPSPKLLFSPRLGFAWDLTGSGKTVLRAGGGVFHYIDRNGDMFSAHANPPLHYSVDVDTGNLTLAKVDTLNGTGFLSKPGLTVLEPGNSKIPATYSWSFTLSKRLPASTVMEASYVGNSSSHQMVCTNCGANLNAVPEGAMFGFPLGKTANDYRPYQTYGTINMRAHALSQNYHSLQVTANRQVGRINFAGAYTFSKAMGVGGDSFGTPSDSFDRRGRSYGPLGYDRTHSFSMAYSIMLPGTFQNLFLKGALSGWQLSGISQVQSGAPLASMFRYSGTLADGVSPWDARYVAGTSDTQVRPYLVCDPRSGLGNDQYANPNCFRAPLPGHNGTYEMPYMKTPPFMNHDLSLFKNFQFSESKKLQFRWSAYNFINHPLAFFNGGADPGLAINFDKTGMPDAKSVADFGRTTLSRGHRLMQLAVKFYF
jgi:carboxypeptidase family protein